MAITNSLSYVNIYDHFVNTKKIFINHLLNFWNKISKLQHTYFRSNYFLIFFLFILLLCLFFNQRPTKKYSSFEKVEKDDKEDILLFINRIREIVILEENFLFNISYSLNFTGIPHWLNQYNIGNLFNFYWLQNGGYLWHLQRMMDIKQKLINQTTNLHQKLSANSHQVHIVEYLNQHPEYGLIIDTASEPIQPLFLPVPRASLPFEKICEDYPWLNDWKPCKTRISTYFTKPLITYALYDVTIDRCNQWKYSFDIKTNHYNELIYLFDINKQLINKTFFVKQILPRLIRLLALVPDTSFILLPYLNSKIYISQYLDVLIERGLINDKNRFIEYNSNEIYHSNVIYSTSSPRSDLILLNKILTANQSSLRPEFILILQKNIDDYSYNQIIQTISQFELPAEYQYLRIQEYDDNEQSYNLTEISQLFQQSRIVIGMPTDLLSHIVWCLPRTHIIEILHPNITTDYYDISIQLQLNYWLALTTYTNQIDMIEFRNLMMKVFSDIDA